MNRRALTVALFAYIGLPVVVLLGMLIAKVFGGAA